MPKGDAFEADLQAFRPGRDIPRGLRLALLVASEPGLTFAWLMRRQLRAEMRGRRRRARLLHLLNLRMTGGEVGHGCTIGPGLVVKHPLGVVIGGGTVIGERCTLLHNVTLGERRPGDSESAGVYPRLGNDVLVGNGAVILGPVDVGHRAVVGAGAVVLRDVPPGETFVGVPARSVNLGS